MKTKITFLADTHYFSPSLTDGGRAYQLRNGSDQKCLLESGALADAAFDLIAASDTRAVMIAGDLTDNGERISHEEFREKLYRLKEKKPVYVITATHDWCSDGMPRRYFGNSIYEDVSFIPAEELRSFYYDFGPRQAKDEFITHLGVFSYVVDLSEEVRLLAINDDQNGKGQAGYSDAHFDWIEKQIKQAQADGKTLLAMEHHLIMPHVHPMISAFGMCVGEREKTASRLADAGLRYIFVGHSHIHRVSEFTSEKGNTIKQFNIGSLAGYPSPIVNVTVENGEVSVETVNAPCFEFNGSRDTLEYTKKHLTDMVDRVIDGAAGKDTAEFADRMKALGIKNEKIPKLHALIRPAAKFLSGVKVSGAYRLLNPLTLGKVIERKNVSEYKDKKVMDFVHEILLDVIGGTPEPHSEDSAYCKLVCQVLSVPSFFVRNNKMLSQLPEVAREAITGGKYSTRNTKL